LARLLPQTQVWDGASGPEEIALSVVRRAISVMSGMRLHTGSLGGGDEINTTNNE
jgi:hypothetical protein